MKKIIKVSKLIAVIFILIVVFSVVDLVRNNNKKFEETKINTHIKNIIADWGNPDKKFIYKDLNNSVVYKYEKDYLGWETYIFVFNPKDSLLVSKYLDD